MLHNSNIFCLHIFSYTDVDGASLQQKSQMLPAILWMTTESFNLLHHRTGVSLQTSTVLGQNHGGKSKAVSPVNPFDELTRGPFGRRIPCTLTHPLKMPH